MLYSLPDGTMDACIALRTMVMRDGVAYLQAGAGVVADSDPAAEHEECLRKLAALEAAIDLAEREASSSRMKLLMIDNYDSFTYNLVHLFEELGAEVVTVRNDAITVDEARGARARPARRLPRPGPPGGRGRLDRADPALGPTMPTLGVCLGHQAIVEAFGGTVGQAKALLHGKASSSPTTGSASTRACPTEVEVGRYHSLAATDVPDELTVTAQTADGEVMGVRHARLPIEGVQFHPESVLTPLGPEMARNFLR